MEEARNAFDSLYSWMRRCRLQPMKDAATTLRNHKEKILAYFYHRITNAVCEGINSMIQAAKRKARGFNTYEGFASMIYLLLVNSNSLSLTLSKYSYPLKRE
ncbi:transposase [Youxingia wuxianensis]|uniref:transposase n=1 Tax=Youxingia wuxianensis TaxID=2763678 RepID=UPI0021CCD088|nr:transposase [Youxingia wuxianensis]